MAKQKGKKNYDCLERLNYLYQASTLLTKTNPQLSRFYSLNLKLTSQKLVQRLDKSIKRSICKGCEAILIPGMTCDFGDDRGLIKWTCRNCRREKNYQKGKDFIIQPSVAHGL